MVRKKVAKKKTSVRKKTSKKKRQARVKNSDLSGPFHFSVNQIAELFSVTRRAVSNWSVEPKGKRGTQVIYYLPDVIRFVVDRAESRPETSFEYTEERARLTHHQANIADLDEQVKRDELFDGKEVLMMCSSAHAAARNRVLGLHSKIKSMYPDLDQEVIEDIEELSIEALNEIGTDGIPPRLAERVQSAIRRMESATEADDQ